MNVRSSTSREMSRMGTVRRWAGRLSLLLAIMLAGAVLVPSADWPIRLATLGTTKPAQVSVQVTKASLPASSPESETKNIEQIQAGDVVLTRAGENESLEPRQVTRTFRRTSDHLRILSVLGSDGRVQEIKTTNEHPFWVPGKGWQLAGDLQAGVQLAEPDGSSATVVASMYEAHPEGVSVYNFEVEGLHTYFVSADGSAPSLLVHNTCSPDFGLHEPSFTHTSGTFGPTGFSGALSNPLGGGSPALAAGPIDIKQVLPAETFQVPSGVSRDLAAPELSGNNMTLTRGIDETLQTAAMLSNVFIDRPAGDVPIHVPQPSVEAGQFKVVNSL
jgi:hypothetical protein